MSATKDIEIEHTFAAPVERVWRAWTSADELTQWLTEKARVQPEVGGPFELFWEPDHPERNSTLGCKLLHVEPTKRLDFTWRGPVLFADLMNVGEPPPTRVSVLFEPNGATTRMRFLHTGWGDSVRWREARAWQEQSWRTAVERLSAVVRS